MIQYYRTFEPLLFDDIEKIDVHRYEPQIARRTMKFWDEPVSPSWVYQSFLEENEEELGMLLGIEDPFEEDIISSLLTLTRYEEKANKGTTCSLARDWKSHHAWIKKTASLTEDQFNCVKGRASSHLYRLAHPNNNFVEYENKDIDVLRSKVQSKICPAFAEDFVRYLSTITPALDHYHTLGVDGIGAEGDGVFSFWTIAPYVHAGLQNHSLNSQKSIEKIVEWVSQSSPHHLIGFRHERRLREGHHLCADERMPSHLAANILAQGVVHYLLKKH